jgi:hypothetical protein
MSIYDYRPPALSKIGSLRTGGGHDPQQCRALVDTYAKSDDLTFSSSGKTTRGWQATLGQYQGRYPTREKIGRLTLGDTAALALGQLKLDQQTVIPANAGIQGLGPLRIWIPACAGMTWGGERACKGISRWCFAKSMGDG